MNWNIFNEDCQDFVRSQNFIDLTKGKKLIVVTDPPFNVGYHYGKYKDKMPDDQYYEWLAQILESCGCPFVIVHYPEALYKLSFQMRLFPERVCSWVYNSNTARQHRDVAFFQVAPLFRQVLQPYKNPNDKRIMKRLAGGGAGTPIYDWWYCDQVKNVSSDKYGHPCQMPLEIMKNIVGVLPKQKLIVFDPFMGSGTTGQACRELGIDFLGTEIDENYFKISQARLEGTLPNGQITFL